MMKPETNSQKNPVNTASPAQSISALPLPHHKKKEIQGKSRVLGSARYTLYRVGRCSRRGLENVAMLGLAPKPERRMSQDERLSLESFQKDHAHDKLHRITETKRAK